MSLDASEENQIGENNNEEVYWWKTHKSSNLKVNFVQPFFFHFNPFKKSFHCRTTIKGERDLFFHVIFPDISAIKLRLHLQAQSHFSCLSSSFSERGWNVPE